MNQRQATLRNGSARSAGARSRHARSSATGKRSSVKRAAQKQVKRRGAVNSRNLKRVKNARRPIPRLLIVLAVCIVIAIACIAAVFSQNDNAKYAACEQYKPVVEKACTDLGLGKDWTDSILAAMFVESGGDKGVSSVMDVSEDIMQAAEGAYGWIVTSGWNEHGLRPQTTDASIYAGVLEFKQNLELWESYLGTITPSDTTEIQLVIQGYNFGADGWFTWCKNKGVRAYTVELAKQYSKEVMPADAKGTPTHAQKWLTAYEVIRSQTQA